MRNGLQKYLLVLLTVGLCALPALAQGPTGSLSGTVTDPKGAVVASDDGKGDQIVYADIRIDERIGQGVIRNRRPEIYREILRAK